MDAKIIITGKVGSITPKNFQGADGTTRECYSISVCYKTNTTKDASGAEVKTFEYASFLTRKNDFTANLQKGDYVTVSGEPKVQAYLKKDAAAPTPIGQLQIERAEVTLVCRNPQGQQGQTVPQGQGYVPQGTPQPQGYVPQGQGYAPQGYMPQGQSYVPQGAPQPQRATNGYGAPQGYVPQGQGYAPQGTPQPQGAPNGYVPQGNFSGEISDDDLPF